MNKRLLKLAMLGLMTLIGCDKEEPPSQPPTVPVAPEAKNANKPGRKTPQTSPGKVMEP